MVIVYSKLEREEPRSSGNCGDSVSLAGNSLASVTATGSVTCDVPPSALTVSVCVPILASFGTSSRRSSDTLSSVAGMAAAIGWPPPSSVAVQPCGHARDRQREPLGRQRVIAQLQVDGRRGAGLHGDRRIVGQQVEALDVVIGVGGEGGRGKREQ